MTPGMRWIYVRTIAGAVVLIIGVDLIAIAFGEGPKWLSLIGAALVGLWHGVWVK